MARTVKARTTCVDNIAVASAMGIERTLPSDGVQPGIAPPAFTTWGNTENISVGVDYSADENLIAVGTDLLAKERLG